MLRRTYALLPHVGAAALGLFLVSPVLGEVVEEWQSRVLQVVQEMDEIGSRYAGREEQFQQRSNDVRREATRQRSAFAGAREQREHACQQSDSADCFEAREQYQEAHLNLTVNVKERLEVDKKRLALHAERSIRMADVLQGALRMIRKGRAKAVKASAQTAGAITERTRSFLAKARPALQSVSRVVRGLRDRLGKDKTADARIRAKMRAASDVLQAIQRFGHDGREMKIGGESLEAHLHRLQSRLVTFAVICRQAGGLIDTRARDVRIVNALVAAQLADQMLGSYSGDLMSSGKAFTKEMVAAAQDYEDDLALMLEGLGERGVEGADDGFFDEGSGEASFFE